MNNPNPSEMAERLTELLAAYRKPGSETSAAFALRSHMVAHADEIIAALRLSRPEATEQGAVERAVVDLSDRLILRMDIAEDDPRLSMIMDEHRERLAALSPIPNAVEPERSCTCHPDDQQIPCPRKFAATDCANAVGGEVVQGDREAAARQMPLNSLAEAAAVERVREGKRDKHHLVQAFRDHRLAHTPAAGEPSTHMIDMANVGEALMEAIRDYSSDEFMKSWHPADCPSEIVGDLLNALEEAQTAPAAGEHAKLIADLEKTYSALTPGAIDTADLDGMAFSVQDAITVLRHTAGEREQIVAQEKGA